jgi:hypothetical protein
MQRRSAMKPAYEVPTEQARLKKFERKQTKEAM